MMRYPKTRDVFVPVTRSLGLILLVLFLSACSKGMRLKNLVNYPVELATLNALDTLRVLPDVINYSGVRELSFTSFNEDVRIQGRQEQRPVWEASSQECFRVDSGADVHILDFNFRGTNSAERLIRVNSGRLILENCDVTGGEEWSIEVGERGKLELRNVRFSNLGLGAIKLNGGQISAYNCSFNQIGQTAIYATEGTILELHKVDISNAMGTALVLNSLAEVWLDSVIIQDSFEDGIRLADCEFVLINQVASKGNGRNGLVLENSVISGLLNFSAIGNLVSGMVATDIDTLRILNSEFVGNGDSGAIIQSVNRNRIAGVKMGHNGSSGFLASDVNDLIIHHSTFQANPGFSISLDSVKSAQIEHVSMVNNGVGCLIAHSDSVKFGNNLLISNHGVAAQFKDTNILDLSLNLVKGNDLGFQVEAVLNVQLDSNRFVSNISGTDMRSVSRITMMGNVWEENQFGSYFSGVGNIDSQGDRWQGNLNSAFELLSVEELLLRDARLDGNQLGGVVHQTSLKVEASMFTSGKGSALKLMSGTLGVSDSKFFDNNIGVELGEGAQASLVQCNFSGNELAIKAEASADLHLSYSKVEKGRRGVLLGSYGKAEILSNRFNEIDGYCIELSGPHLQSLVLRQNILSRTGGILKSQTLSGKINVSNNTFSNNHSGFSVLEKSIDNMNHNIFHKTAPVSVDILRDPVMLRSNCFSPDQRDRYPKEIGLLNLFANPEFDADYYLQPQSPCLRADEKGVFIGALGSTADRRPVLHP